MMTDIVLVGHCGGQCDDDNTTLCWWGSATMTASHCAGGAV